MIYICRPKRIGIYINNRRLTIDQIRAETGADVVINGGLFTANFSPVCHLKSNGTVFASDPYKYWGYGWNMADIRLTQDYANLQNYICCCCMVRNGKPENLIYNPDMGGKRERTALGLFPDGRVWFYAASNKMTPSALQSLALSAGLESAIMLDGGGSTQGISPNGAYRQNRICHNYILAWLSDKPQCPYAEPTRNVGRWCLFYTKDMARWVQWKLNEKGYPLDIDGVFGKKSDEALRKFQSDNGLSADGVCGKMTREVLKQ